MRAADVLRESGLRTGTTAQNKAGQKMETVERLTEQEALAAKKMWSEIFYEDSEQFTDYYFAEKMVLL